MDKMLSEIPSLDDSALLNPKFKNLSHIARVYKDLTQEYKNIPDNVKGDVAKEDALIKKYKGIGDSYGWFTRSVEGYISTATGILNGETDYSTLENQFAETIVSHKYISSVFKEIKNNKVSLIIYCLILIESNLFTGLFIPKKVVSINTIKV